MQNAAHAAAQRVINRLMLLHPWKPAKTLADYARGIMVAVTCKVGNFYLGVGQGGFDHALYLFGLHCH